jgi:hypothetical protein
MDNDPEPFRSFLFEPKPEVNGSWWANQQTPEHTAEWYAVARAEAPRMQGSKVASRLYSKCLDDV